MTYYLNLSPNESGAYPPPQDRPGDGLIRISEEQRDTVIQYGGFVKVEENRQPDGSMGYTITPDVEAWEAWKKENPEPPPEPSDSEILDTLLGVRK